MAAKITLLCVVFMCILALSCCAKKRNIKPGKIAKTSDVPWLTPEVQEFLAKTKLEDLPESVQRIARAVGDNDHWCCAISTMKNLITSHAVQKYYTTSHHTKYYRGCGWWGWSRCSVRQTHYRQNAGYFTSYRQTLQQISCPDRHAVCCQGYLLVAEHCLPLSQLANIKDDLIKLHEMGLLNHHIYGYSIGQRVKGVFWLYKGRYSMTFESAAMACRSVGAKLASPDQLNAAYLAGMNQCNCGWINDRTARYPITKKEFLIWQCGGSTPGVRSCGSNTNSKYDAYCYKPDLSGYNFGKPVKGVFWLAKGRYTLTYNDADRACKDIGARLASLSQLRTAYYAGMDQCNCGWTSDKSSHYPISKKEHLIWQCGGSSPGVRTCGSNTNYKWDAYCYNP